jgi:peptide-methionine (S)-S-oxide reductase
MKDPTYHDLGDHSESFQIDFDPTVISYDKILELFWSAHNPCRKAYSTQYKTALFYADDEQKLAAERTRAGLALKMGSRLSGPVQTGIFPLKHFYLAEDYHQKYSLRNDRELMREFDSMYPKLEDFVNSTAAARVNSYLSGSGSREMLMKEIDKLGLSEAGKRHLLERVR